LPKGLQGKAKSMIHDMYMADTKENTLKAYRHFLDVYSAKYPKAVECLQKDEAVLFSFYEFPAARWFIFVPPIRLSSLSLRFDCGRYGPRDVFGCCETTSISLLFAYGRDIYLLPPVQLYYVRPLFATAASAWPRQRPNGEFLPAP